MQQVVALGALLAVSLVAGSASAIDVPPLRGRVNDLAGLLDRSQRAGLESKLEAYERRTGQQFALLIVPSLAGDAIESFSIRVVEAWQLGKKGRDDGVLLLVALEDRAVRIEVGYGLEGSITDAHSARIIRNVIVPAFRQQRFAAGLEQALDLLMQLGGGEAAAIPEGDGGGAQVELPSWINVVMLIVFLVLPLMFRIMGMGRRRRGFWGGFYGGGFGGGGGFSGGGGGFGGGGASGRW